MPNEGEFLVNVYPNPTSGESNLEFYVPLQTKVNIEIYDMEGRLLQTILREEAREAGLYMVHIDLSNYPQGIYIIDVRTAHQKKILRLVKL